MIAYTRFSQFTPLAVVITVLLAGCDSSTKDTEKKDTPEPSASGKDTLAKSTRREEVEKKLRELAEQPEKIDELIAYCNELYKDEDPEVSELAAGLMINYYLGLLKRGDVAVVPRLEHALDVLLTRDALGPLHLALTMQAAGWMERMDQVDAAKRFWQQIEEKFKDHEDADVAADAKDVTDRARRRLGMIGNQIELSGTLVRGGELDWSKYRGKVVLVDFWATWCPPCVAEVPHLKKLYEKYHDQGFDILGISLDGDSMAGTAREQIERFFTDRDISWDSVYFAAADKQNWDNPIAEKYGIGGLPQGLLVGRDGNVIALNALGKKLDGLLEKEFPKNEPEKTEAGEKDK